MELEDHLAINMVILFKQESSMDVKINGQTSIKKNTVSKYVPIRYILTTKGKKVIILKYS